jgi:2-hydroxy-3-keto-5-methylthiopentenyl-1-phosphate phosphatase
MKSRIFCDFDGTITREDTLVLLLDRFGRHLPDGRDWRAIEFDDTLDEQVKLQAEMDLLDCTREEALEFLRDTVQIREGFSDFLHWIRSESGCLHVLSGGLLPIIEQSLAEYAGVGLELEANQLFGDTGWQVKPNSTPRIRERCNHCKTQHVRRTASQQIKSIYIGDGSTDFCPAREADMVFARGTLARQLQEEGRTFTAYEDFHHVLRALKQAGVTLATEL